MNKKYLPIILLTFVNILGFTVLIPVLPAVVGQYVSDEYIGFAYGALLSIYAGFQFLAAPVFGSLSDHFGRKPILFLSQLGTTLSWVLFAAAYFIPSEILLFGLPVAFLVIIFSRITDGITGGNISVANAWVSDVTKPEDKTKIFGLLGGVFGIGFVVGPAIGGLSVSTPFGFLLTALIQILISSVTLWYIAYRLPETLPKEDRRSNISINILREINLIRQMKTFENKSLIENVSVLKTAFAIIFATYTSLIVLVLGADFSLTPIGIGILMSFIGVSIGFNQVLVTPFVAKKIGDEKTIFLGTLLLIAALILLSLTVGGKVNSLAFGYVLLVNFLFTLAASLCNPTFKAIYTNAVSKTEQGKITGIDESINSLGNAVSPIISGLVFVAIAKNTFVIAACILLFVLLFLFIRTKKLFSFA
jgi:MFS family permease